VILLPLLVAGVLVLCWDLRATLVERMRRRLALGGERA
jgi:hypothetical protein